MKYAKMLIAFLILLLLGLQGEAAVSQQTAWEAFRCESEVQAKKLLPKYEALKSPDKYLYMGIVYHNLGASNESYIEKAVEMTKKAMDETQSPLAQGYYGSSLNIKSGVAFKKGDMGGAMQWLEQGMRNLDEAVTKSPENTLLRVVRIINSYEITRASPFNRMDLVKKDLEALKSKKSSLDKNIKSIYHLFNGLAALMENRGDDGAAELEKAVKSAPKSGWAARARRELKKLEN